MLKTPHLAQVAARESKFYVRLVGPAITVGKAVRHSALKYDVGFTAHW